MAGTDDAMSDQPATSKDYWNAHTWELPSHAPSAHAPTGAQRSVAVGAVVCPLPLVQAVRKALDENRWLKKHGVNVSRFVGSVARSESYRQLHLANRAEALRARKVLKELSGQDGAEEMTITDDGDVHLPILPPSPTGPAALMACHVAPEGAKVLDLATSGHPKAGKLPDNLAALLAPGGGAYWVPGLRVGSPECLHKGDGPGSRKDNLNKTATANCSETTSLLKRSQTFTFAELFAGVGGFRVGLEAVGGRCVFSSEIDREAVATYKLNHGDSGELYGDITELEVEDLPPHDLLCAGWPCQPFSRAGFQAGFEDIDRGHLFFEIIRCVQAARPRVLILENVANLVKVEEGRVLASVLVELAGNGYKAFHKVINARAILPQQRERLYIVAFRCEEGSYIAHPEEEEENARLRKTADVFNWPDLKVVPRCVKEVLQEEVDLAEFKLTEHQRSKVMASQNWASGCRVARLEGGARTLMASYKRSYHLYSEFVPAGNDMQESAELPKELRFYTPRECARLMGFPESFRVGESTNRNAWYHQCGNAVCPPIIAAIMAAVQVALDKSDGSGVDGAADKDRIDEAVAKMLLAASPCPAEVRARLEGAGYKLS